MELLYSDIRSNAKTGIIEYKPTIPTENGKSRYIVVSEWWNGEGVDIFMSDEEGESETISMEFDDWKALKSIMADFCQDEEEDEEVGDVIERMGITSPTPQPSRGILREARIDDSVSDDDIRDMLGL